MTKTTINIHGKEYETVASRVQRFRERYKFEYCLFTEIIYRGESEVVMKATIAAPDGTIIATGHAEESRTSSQINRTSALENCETSAIGRALAAFGMAGTEYASADEVANAIHQQAAPAKAVPPLAPVLATPIQKQQLKAFMHANGVADDDMATFLKTEYGVEGKTLTKARASEIIEDLK